MSQSPDGSADSTDTNVLSDYRNAWSALSQLIGKGRSFSGRERNCCFLNLGNGRFADVSAALDVDLIADSRAVALCDWNLDGAQDLWLANRTAPRIRLLLNQTNSNNRWIAFRLRGTTSNRDAIGARIKLYLADSATAPLIKTLHAGDGYLSQSSKWVHFGIGKSDSVRYVEVIWPGGTSERFSTLDANQRYRLTQGSGRPVRWTPPNASPVTIQPPDSDSEKRIIRKRKATVNSRTWIMGRVPLPWEIYRATNGDLASLAAFRGRPVLVNLWSRSCVPCLQELEEWAAKPELSKACHVLPLCVDGLEGNLAALETSFRLLESLNPSFTSGSPTTELLDGMESLQRTILELQQPLPVPCSFLLDRFGRVAAIYKGRVPVAQLLGDLELLRKDRLRQRDAAVPFPGRWASQPFPFDPMPLVKTLELAGRDDQALDYLNRYAQLIDNELPQEIVKQEGHAESRVAVYQQIVTRTLERGDPIEEILPIMERLRQIAPNASDTHRQIASRLLQRRQANLSLLHFELAVSQNEREPNLLYNYGLALISVRRVDEAIGAFRAALREAPNDAATHFHLANAYQMIEPPQYRDAIRHYRSSLRANPKAILAANNLAWILATSADHNLRDGQEAVRWSRLSCEQTNFADPAMLATLACAYAEAGEFKKARNFNQKALELAKKLDRPARKLISDLTARQNLFESRQPFRNNTD